MAKLLNFGPEWLRSNSGDDLSGRSLDHNSDNEFQFKSSNTSPHRTLNVNENNNNTSPWNGPSFSSVVRRNTAPLNNKQQCRNNQQKGILIERNYCDRSSGHRSSNIRLVDSTTPVDFQPLEATASSIQTVEGAESRNLGTNLVDLDATHAVTLQTTHMFLANSNGTYYWQTQKQSSEIYNTNEVDEIFPKLGCESKKGRHEKTPEFVPYTAHEYNNYVPQHSNLSPYAKPFEFRRQPENNSFSNLNQNHYISTISNSYDDTNIKLSVDAKPFTPKISSDLPSDAEFQESNVVIDHGFRSSSLSRRKFISKLPIEANSYELDNSESRLPLFGHSSVPWSSVEAEENDNFANENENAIANEYHDEEEDDAETTFLRLQEETNPFLRNDWNAEQYDQDVAFSNKTSSDWWTKSWQNHTGEDYFDKVSNEGLTFSGNYLLDYKDGTTGNPAAINSLDFSDEENRSPNTMRTHMSKPFLSEERYRQDNFHSFESIPTDDKQNGESDFETPSTQSLLTRIDETLEKSRIRREANSLIYPPGFRFRRSNPKKPSPTLLLKLKTSEDSSLDSKAINNIEMKSETDSIHSCRIPPPVPKRLPNVPPDEQIRFKLLSFLNDTPKAKGDTQNARAQQKLPKIPARPKVDIVRPPPPPPRRNVQASKLIKENETGLAEKLIVRIANGNKSSDLKENHSIEIKPPTPPPRRNLKVPSTVDCLKRELPPIPISKSDAIKVREPTRNNKLIVKPQNSTELKKNMATGPLLNGNMLPVCTFSQITNESCITSTTANNIVNVSAASKTTLVTKPSNTNPFLDDSDNSNRNDIHNDQNSTLTSFKPNAEQYHWFYFDPHHVLQGPFTSIDMAEWHLLGYFDESLVLRRHCDTTFTTLGQLIKLTGQYMPF